eukprot:134826-Prorocentrum_minimum.AAC.1
MQEVRVYSHDGPIKHRKRGSTLREPHQIGALCPQTPSRVMPFSNGTSNPASRSRLPGEDFLAWKTARSPFSLSPPDPPPRSSTSASERTRSNK